MSGAAYEEMLRADVAELALLGVERKLAEVLAMADWLDTFDTPVRADVIAGAIRRAVEGKELFT